MVKKSFPLEAVMHYSTNINPLVFVQLCKDYKKYYDESSHYSLIFTVEMKESFPSWQYSLKTTTGKIIEPHQILKLSDLKIIFTLEREVGKDELLFVQSLLLNKLSPLFNKFTTKDYPISFEYNDLSNIQMCPLSIITYICKPLADKFCVFIRNLDIVCHSDWYSYEKSHYDVAIAPYDYDKSNDYKLPARSVSFYYEKRKMTSILERAYMAHFQNIEKLIIKKIPKENQDYVKDSMQSDMCGFAGASCFFFKNLKSLQLMNLNSCFAYYFIICLMNFNQPLNRIITSSDISIDVNEINEINEIYGINNFSIIFEEKSSDFDMYKIISN